MPACGGTPPTDRVTPLKKEHAMNARRVSRASYLVLLSVFLCAVATPSSPVTAGEADSHGSTDNSGRTILLKGARPISDEPAQRVYFTSSIGDKGELETVYRRLVEVDARHIDIYYPDVIVCEVPLRVDPWSVLEGTAVTARTQASISGAPAGSLPYNLEIARRTFARIDSRRQSRREDLPHAHAPSNIPPQAAIGREAPGQDIAGDESPLAEPGESNRVTSAAAQDDRRYDQNTEFLAGPVHIQIVFMQGRTEEPWTSVAKRDAEILVRSAADWFKQQLRNSELGFSTRSFTAETQYLPINTVINDAREVEDLVHDVMNNMDPPYVGESYLFRERVGQFNNDARSGNSPPDWVFTVFLANSADDPDHRFRTTPGKTAALYAELGGPFMILPFPAGLDAEPATFEQWFQHGMATVFWAMGEDIGSRWVCDERSGYLNVAHGNKIIHQAPPPIVTCEHESATPCISWFWSLFLYPQLCEYTAGMLGGADENGNNVPDVFDAAPEVVFHGTAVETLTTLDQPVNFSVIAKAVINRNPKQTPPRIHYAVEIEKVAYTLNTIGPYFVYPVDGVVDEVEEDYVVNFSFLLPGPNTVAVTTWNKYSAKSESPATKQLFYVGVFYDNYFVEQKNEGLGIGWDVVLGPFNADGPEKNVEFELYRIDYLADSTVSLVCTTADLQPVGPEANGYTPYYFLDKNVKPGAGYGYYVVGTVEIEYRGEMTGFPSTSKVINTTAALPRAGLLSSPAPNPYQPMVANQDLLVSVEVPGASGMFRPAGSTDIPPAVGLTVGVYDVAGRRVKQLFGEGVYARVVNVEWDGTNSRGEVVPSGIYFIKAQVGDIVDARKVLVLR